MTHELEQNLSLIVQSVAETFLRAQVVPIQPPSDSRAAWPPEALGAVVELDGTWSGSIRVIGSRRLALQAAMAMFDSPLERLTAADACDAIGELATVIVGNLKSLAIAGIAGESHISPPVVSRSLDAAELGDGTGVSWFLVGGESLVISITAHR